MSSHPVKNVELTAPAIPGAADLDLTSAPFTYRTLKAVAGTEFVPAAYRNKPEAILACIMAGRELGMGPMESLRRIDVIDGNATPSGEWMIAQVFARGHTIETKVLTQTKCVLVGKRYRDGAVLATQEVEFNFNMAQRAGLTGKNNWKKYPEAMLYWRAATMLCRQFFPDCLSGLKYVAEELGSEEWTEEPQAGVKVEGNQFVETVPVEVVIEDNGDTVVVVDPSGQEFEVEIEEENTTINLREHMGTTLVAPDSDPAWEELLLLLDHPDFSGGTIPNIEQRTRKLFQLMSNLRVWPSDAIHVALYSDYGAQHWGDLKVKATYQEFATKWHQRAVEDVGQL